MNLFKEIWLLLSGFGIMFAILSWLQESGVLSADLGALKGLFAVISGILLYLGVARNMDSSKSTDG